MDAYLLTHLIHGASLLDKAPFFLSLSCSLVHSLIHWLQTKGELDLVHKKLQEEQGKLAEVAKEARQLEAAAVAAKAEADTAASQCLDQSKRTAGLLAEQQDLQKVLDRKRTAAQAQV